MKRILTFLLAGFLLLPCALGCHGASEKGINSGKDQPKPGKDG